MHFIILALKRVYRGMPQLHILYMDIKKEKKEKD